MIPAVHIVPRGCSAWRPLVRESMSGVVVGNTGAHAWHPLPISLCVRPQHCFESQTGFGLVALGLSQGVRGGAARNWTARRHR